MFRWIRRRLFVLRGIIGRILLFFNPTPADSDCKNCEWGFTADDGTEFKDCDPPELIPEKFYEDYGDDELPKHCGCYKRNPEVI